MNIHISIDAPDADTARAEMARLLGTTALSDTRAQSAVEGRRPLPPAEAGFLGDTSGDTEANDADPAPPRERGKPSPGHARRTKAEIAEDDAADKADAAVRAAGEETGAVVADKQVEPAVKIVSESGVTAEDRPLVSTGGPRVDPNNPEDDAQDAADEAADTAATSGAKLTHDSVRSALGLYVQKFGMDAAQQDCPKVISMVCGEGVAKVSAIPDDQAIIQKVVDGIYEMIEKNPFKRTATVA